MIRAAFISFLAAIHLFGAVDYTHELAGKSYAIDGTFGQYDFPDADSAFDWAYTASNGAVYRLRGNTPTDNDLFGWKAVAVASPMPQWYMFSLGGDLDQDGSRKFDWILVNGSGDAVYKLAGVSPAGNFVYSAPIITTATFTADKKSLTFAPAQSSIGTLPDPLCPAPGGESISGALYTHQIGMATGTDGVHFTTDGRYIIEHASVPDAVRKADGNFLIYYVNGATTHQHGIYVSEVSPEGTLLGTTCTTIDGTFRQNAVDPDIHIAPDGAYRLCYYGNFGPPNSEPNRFYCADAADGIHFENERLIHQNSAGTDPSITRLSGENYLLAYACEGSICFATAGSDLLFSDSAVLAEEGIPEVTALENGTIRLYAGNRSLLSIDGAQTWTPELNGNTTDGKVSKVYSDPSIVKTVNGWTLFFKVLTD